MARVYREAPLNSVWEGTANMMGMDVRRALRKDPRCRDALVAEWAEVRGQHAGFDAFTDRLAGQINALLDDEFLARPVTEALARAIQGAELIRHAPSEVVGAFMNSRLGQGWGCLYGSMGTGVTRAQADAIVDRARVVR